MASLRPHAKPAHCLHASAVLLRWRLVGLLLLGLCGLLGRADDALADEAHPTIPAAEERAASPYAGEWDCRYGDLPIIRTRERVTVRVGRAGFQPCRPPKSPPGRGQNNFLWMRTTLGGVDFHEPTLFLQSMDQIFEAYLDGKLVYRFGELDAPELRHYAGHRPHYIPLGSDYQGKLLELRIYSEHIKIGIVGQVLIGSRLGLTVATMRSGLDELCIGVVLMCIGFLALAIYATRRKDSLYGAYGGFALAIGVYIAVYSQTRTQELAHTLRWNYLELFALYCTAPCFLQFTSGLIGPGPFGLTRHMVKFHIGFLFLAVLGSVAGLVPVMTPVVAFTFLLLFDSVYVLGVALAAARSGHSEAQIFFAALTLPVAFMVYDSLAALGVVARASNMVTPLSMLFFVAMLALIPIRRLVQLQKTRERALKREVESAINQRRLSE